MECPRCKRERWKPVTGFEQYQISDHGRVRSKTGRLMRPGKLRRGHLRVTFSVNGERTSFQVHHLVLLEFVGPRPEGSEGVHNNDEPSDNCFKNLRWATHSENMRDAVNNGRMPNVHSRAVRAAVVASVAEGTAVIEESRRRGIPRRTIYDWLREAGVRRPKASDRKDKIVAAVLEGALVRDTALKYGVSERALYKWLAAKRRRRGRS